ncbi:hypothetical protein Drorol1_Dr00004163 [Drosera rotundifolia]
MDTVKGKKLHIVMLPWLAYGHITPFLELSKRLAEKGHHISFVSTPRNIGRLPEIPEHLTPLINLVKLPFPPDKIDEGLPPGAESMSDISSNKLPLLLKAFEGLQDQIAEFLESSIPDWIMYDPFAFWVLPLFAASKKLARSVSKALFLNISASSLCFYFPSSQGNDISVGRSNLEDFLFPPKWIPFPNKLAYRTHEVISVAEQLDGYADDAVTLPQCFHTSVTGCDAIFMQGCLELEANYFKLLEELHGRRVLATGLLTPAFYHQGIEDDGWQLIKDWLGKRENGSVVYIALGSEATPSQQMLTELALGLELSELPFFWALRKPKADEDSLELPDGFEERTKDRGLVWRSWAPQLKILHHDSIGGFLSHCGWNSTLDGLQFGRPFIMLPLHGDQGLNARLLEEKEVGIEIPRDELDGSFTRNSVAETLKLVLMDEAGKLYREKAAQMRELVGDRNLHQQYIDKLEEFMCSKNRRDE